MSQRAQAVQHQQQLLQQQQQGEAADGGEQEEEAAEEFFLGRFKTVIVGIRYYEGRVGVNGECVVRVRVFFVW